MPQLKLIFYADTTPIQDIPAADGFRLRNTLDSDLAEYNRLRSSVEFNVWEPEYLAEYRKKTLSDGMFAIEELKTGKLTAAASAELMIQPEFADVGYLGWVMTDPEYRGLRLGKCASVAAMRRLYQEGYRVFMLHTDDFRIPALKVYLSLGWKPWLYLDEMEARWRAIAAKLELPFESLGALPQEILFPRKRS